MNKATVIIFFLVLSLTGCSDGMKTGQKLDSILKENEVEFLVLVTNVDQEETVKIEDVVIEDQFLKLGNQYINLGLVKILKVDGNRLELEF